MRRHFPIKFTTVTLLCLVLLIAGFLRYQYVQQAVDDIHIAKDAEQYVNYGRNLVLYRTFSYQHDKLPPTPDSFRSPGYPLFIAMIMKIGGKLNYLKLVLYSQVFLSTALVPLTFFTGTFFMSIPASMLAALLVAISPHLITTSACVLTETLFSILLLSAICVFQLSLKYFSICLAGISAVLFGWAFLTNETVLFLPFILVSVILWFRYFSIAHVFGKRKIQFVIFFIAIYMTVPSGWWLRNYFNVPAGGPKGSDRAVVTMSHGAYPDFIYKDPHYWGIPYREDPQQPYFGSSIKNFSEVLWTRVKDEPLRYLVWYLIGKPYYFWNWNIIQGTGDIYINPIKSDLFIESMFAANIKKVMAFLHPLFLLLTLFSIPVIFFKKKMIRIFDRDDINVALIPMIACLYFTIIYSIFAPWPRYSIPLRPELYLCAIWTLSIIVRYLRKQKVRS